MKKILPALLFIILIASCRKDDAFTGKYRDITGTWTSTNIAFDSSGVRVIRSIPYDRLDISDDLTYRVFYKSENQVEQGFIELKKQTNDSLVLFFHAQYPSYSSFAGSHIFGFSTVALEFLTNDVMVLKATDASYYPGMEFKFTR